MSAQLTIAHTPTNVVVGAAPIELVGIGESGRTWRRHTAEGRYVHGRTLIGAVMETPTLNVVLRITGDTWTAVANRRNSVLAAVSQLSYTATLTIAGVTTTYACEPADVFESKFDHWKVEAKVREMSLTIPVAP